MTQRAKSCCAVSGSVMITSMLFLFLLAGAMTSNQQKPTLLHGAIRLSQFQNEPVREQEIYSASDIPQVESLENVQPTMDTSLDQPKLEMAMPGMDMDIATEMAGTIPVAGLTSLASLSAVGPPCGGALTLGQVDEAPRPLYAPTPLYPSSEKARGVEMTIMLEIIIRADGTVEHVRAIKETPQSKPFHDAAEKALAQWRFSPGRKGERAVKCLATVPFSFKLD